MFQVTWPQNITVLCWLGSLNSIAKEPFPVGFVDRHQTTSNWHETRNETNEKAWAATAVFTQSFYSRLQALPQYDNAEKSGNVYFQPRSQGLPSSKEGKKRAPVNEVGLLPRVSTENGWESVLMENLNRSQ